MSMVGLALRMAAVRALMNDDTIADERVFDSAILPMDQFAENEPKPFIIVSTDNEVGKPTGRDVSNGDNEIDLLIEIAMASITPLPGKDENNNLVNFDVFETDATLELGLAVLRRQIFGCLFGRGGGQWGDVFREFVAGLGSTLVVRGGNVKDGTRFAGRQIVITVKAISEPPFGPVQAGTPWQKFIEALESDPSDDVKRLGRVIKAAIETTPLGWPETYTAAAVLGGYNEREAEAIGLTMTDSEGVPITQAIVTPDGWLIDAAAVEAQLPEGPE